MVFVPTPATAGSKVAPEIPVPENTPPGVAGVKVKMPVFVQAGEVSPLKVASGVVSTVTEAVVVFEQPFMVTE